MTSLGKPVSRSMPVAFGSRTPRGRTVNGTRRHIEPQLSSHTSSRCGSLESQRWIADALRRPSGQSGAREVSGRSLGARQ